MPELPLAGSGAGLDELALAPGLLGDGLAIGHLGLADIGLHPELPDHPVHQDLQVQLAHPRDHGLPAFLIDPDPESGVFLGQAVKRSRSLSWSALVLGSIATVITGSANSIDSKVMGYLLSQSVSPVKLFFSPTTATMSPAKAHSSFLALIGVHQEELGDPLPVPPSRIICGHPGRHFPRIDSQI